jgi:hypothetical protein
VTNITRIKILTRMRMLRVTRTANGEVVFKLSGQIETKNIAELKALLSAETSGRRVHLELSDLILVDQDVVSFLRHCEADGIDLKNCPAYVREWMKQEKS